MGELSMYLKFEIFVVIYFTICKLCIYLNFRYKAIREIRENVQVISEISDMGLCVIFH